MPQGLLGVDLFDADESGKFARNGSESPSQQVMAWSDVVRPSVECGVVGERTSHLVDKHPYAASSWSLPSGIINGVPRQSGYSGQKSSVAALDRSMR
jgi:hypothetical protein